MIRSAAVAAFFAVIFGPPTAHAFGGSWQCENQMDMDRDEARAIAPNNGLFNILNKYRERWDIQHMHEQCAAFAVGGTYDISCLDDRRDWDAIKAMVPIEFFGKSNEELTPDFQALQTHGEEFIDVIAYCRSVGAIK